VEVFPVFSGVLLGVALRFLSPRARWRAGAPLALALGLLSTVLSGEFLESWGFLVVDVPLVAGAAAVTAAAIHFARPRKEV
jgi:hypothetical protein